MHQNLFDISLDLTTYDTVKQLLLKHTHLEDKWITHILSRYSIIDF